MYNLQCELCSKSAIKLWATNVQLCWKQLNVAIAGWLMLQGEFEMMQAGQHSV